MTNLRALAILSCILLSLSARAAIEELGQPADLEQPAYLSDEPQQLSLEERLKKLETQVDNINQKNAASPIEELRQNLQEFRGQIEKQAHQIQVLAHRQKQFYQDLSSRISSQSAVRESKNSTTTTSEINLPAAVADQTKLYRNAFQSLKSKRYNDAIIAFQQYLSKYPNGTYAVNSYYWMGEVYYLQGKAAQAEKAFNMVAKEFPNSKKMPDALLKLAIIAIDAGKTSHGKELLEKVQKNYPGTTAARLATLRYQELRLNS